ncbi:unnamed protein product [Diamesa hyperborea]
MANIRISFAFAVVSCILLLQSPVEAQAPPKTTVDFILDVVELLSEELINRLANINLPEIQLPSLPQIQIPAFPTLPEIPSISLPQIELPSQISPFNYYPFASQEQYINWKRQNPQSPINFIPGYPGPNYPSPNYPGKPPCDNCEPEKVKIIVVDDCDDKKSSEESSEESNEQKVIYRKGRYNYKKFNKN